MDYFTNLFKKTAKSLVVTTGLVFVLWGTLYYLTDFSTVATYFWLGVAVCVLNTMIANLRERRMANILYVKGSWVIMAGVVLVLYYAGFTAAAVFAAAAILASPFFWATVYEGIVGLALLIVLIRLMP